MCQTATNVRELIGLSVVNEAGSTVLKVCPPAQLVLTYFNLILTLHWLMTPWHTPPYATQAY